MCMYNFTNMGIHNKIRLYFIDFSSEEDSRNADAASDGVRKLQT